MFRRRLIWNGTPKAPIVDGVPLIANVGDIAYKASNGKIMVVAPDAWSTSLGTPVGVVVIPSGFAPDNGKARIISLSYAYVYSIAWGDNTDTELTNYRYLYVLANNATGDYNEGATDSGYLPSDILTGAASSIDPIAKYASGKVSRRITSPYRVNSGKYVPNPAYYEQGMYENALSDFSGKRNTDVLVKDTAHAAAMKAHDYSAGGMEWYLPAAGELGYLTVRLGVISNSLTKVFGSEAIRDGSGHWSSTEHNESIAFFSVPNIGAMSNSYKYTTYYVRPFAMLDF